MVVVYTAGMVVVYTAGTVVYTAGTVVYTALSSSTVRHLSKQQTREQERRLFTVR